MADPNQGPGTAPWDAPTVAESERSKAEWVFDGGMSSWHPRSVGRYEILSRLGSGATGLVLEARDPTSDRSVAIKLLHPEMPERSRQRMRREGRALARLSHPNVVEVYEIGEHRGRMFVVMELIGGQTLHRWQRGAPPPSWREVVATYVEAGEGLAAAHVAGLVHRDFKPSNCMRSDDGRVRVLDFGLAKPLEDEESELPPVVEESIIPSRVTRTGAVLGTPAYMAPEQLHGELVDARADQYAFCASLFEAVYGRLPRKANSLDSLVRSFEREIEEPSSTKVPRSLFRVLLRGLAVDPQQRWPSMDALLERLRRTVALRRRWVLPSVLAVAIGGIVIGAWPDSGAAQPRCADAKVELDGVWDPARAEGVGAAILGTELPYAADTWFRVEQQLDEYAEAWADKRTEVCEATLEGGSQSVAVMEARLACLGRAKVALREAVTVLSSSDVDRLSNATSLISSLPSPVRCDDVEALSSGIPLPEDPAERERVEALRERLAEVTALRLAGEYDEALDRVEALRPLSDKLGYGPSRVEVSLEVGRIYIELGRYTDAEAELDRGYLLAAEQGHLHALTVDILGELTAVVGDHLGRPDDGLRWGRAAMTLAHGPEGRPDEQARVLRAVGSVLQTKGDLDEALEHQRRALELMESERGSNHPDLGDAYDSIGIVLRDQGKLDEALEHQRRALAVLESSLGPRHPRLAMLLANTGVVLRDMGKLDESLQHFERALELSHSGPDDPRLATILGNIGTVHGSRGELDEAVEYFVRAQEVLERTLGPRHIDVGIAHDNIGVALMHMKRDEQALERLRRAASIYDEVLGPGHARSIKVGLDIGWLLVSMGRLDDAEEHFGTRRDRLEEALGARSPERVRFIVGSVDVARNRGDATRAAELARSIVEEIDLVTMPPPEAARTRYVLAIALWHDPAERERAVALAEAARDRLDQADPVQVMVRSEIEQWLSDPLRRRIARRTGAVADR